MLEAGKFLFKVQKYMYCERYMVAMDTPAYAELVKHPAPACILNFPLAILSLIPREKTGTVEDALKTASEYFQLVMFWLENLLIIPIFFAYELLLVPFAYLINFITLIKTLQEKDTSVEGDEKNTEPVKIS